MSEGGPYTPELTPLIKDDAVKEELERIAAAFKGLARAVESLGGGGQTRFDAERGLDTGNFVQTLTDSEDGADFRGIRWRFGPWYLNSKGQGSPSGGAVIFPPPLTSNVNNYAPVGLDTAIGLELYSDTDRIITGIRTASDQRRLLFVSNVGNAETLTFVDESPNSVAEHRFSLGATGETLVLQPGGLAWFYYNVQNRRWSLFAMPAVAPDDLPGLLRGSAAWKLLSSQNATGTDILIFTDLGDWNEILIVVEAVTTDAICIIQAEVSTDNGASYLTTSGDYKTLEATGIPANDTALSFHNSQATAARYCWKVIQGFNTAQLKVVSAHFMTANGPYVIPTTTPLNALRVRTHTGSGANFSGGIVRVYGR